MKNYQSITIASLIFALLSPAQGVGQNYAELDINNVRAGMTNTGVLFNDGVNPAFEVPKGSGLHSFYSANTVLSGSNANGQRTQTINEFYGTYSPGPVSTDPANNSTIYGVSKVNKTEIDAHIANNQTPGYTMPLSIQNWPAHGDTAYGESFLLAPFFDANGNNLYDPVNGDYPIIKGDQAIFSIVHYQMGLGVGIEVHTMLYAYACSDDNLDQAVFSDIKFYNRSYETLFDTYVGHLVDMDIGDANNDFLQTEVELGSFYTFDPFGLAGSYSIPTAQTITVLAGPFQDADGVDNSVGIGLEESLNGWGYGDGIVDNERLGLMYSIYPGGAILNDAVGIYNHLRGNMSSGSPYTVGSPAVPYRFAFPGSSDPQGWGTNGAGPYQWDEIGLGNFSGDRNGVTSSGPFLFVPDQMVQLEEVFIFDSDSIQVTSTLPTTIAGIRNAVTTGSTPCGDQIVLGVENTAGMSSFLEELSLYPNPAKTNFSLKFPNELGTVNVRIINALGQEVEAVSNVQSGQQLNIQKLSRGVYFVNIQAQNQKRTMRLIVQ